MLAHGTRGPCGANCNHSQIVYIESAATLWPGISMPPIVLVFMLNTHSMTHGILQIPHHGGRAYSSFARAKPLLGMCHNPRSFYSPTSESALICTSSSAVRLPSGLSHRHRLKAIPPVYFPDQGRLRTGFATIPRVNVSAPPRIP